MEDLYCCYINENFKWDCIENYELIKQDYVVEDYVCGCLVENIEILFVFKERIDIVYLVDVLFIVVNSVVVLMVVEGD